MGVRSIPEPSTGQWVSYERLVVIDALDLDQKAFDSGRQSAPATRVVGKTTWGIKVPAAWTIVVLLAVVSLGLIGWSLRRGEPAESGE